MNLNGSFKEAMEYVAERRVFRKLAAPAEDAQSARQALGILGVDPNAVESAISGLNTGAMAPGAAVRKIRSGVPGTFSQIKHLPHSIGVALQQGRPEEALAAADVLGLKNLSPFSDEFSPVTGLGALTAGYGAAKTHGAYAKAQAMRERLAGRQSDDVKAMAHALGGNKSQEFKAWDQWRTAKKPDPPGLWSRLQSLRQAAASRAKSPSTLWGDIKAQAKAPFHVEIPSHLGIAKNQLEAATKFRVPQKGAPGKLPGPGLLRRAAIPLAAAAVPLAIKEWWGSGHRSGKRPAQQLVEANLAMHKEKDGGGLAAQVRNLFGGTTK